MVHANAVTMISQAAKTRIAIPGVARRQELPATGEQGPAAARGTRIAAKGGQRVRASPSALVVARHPQQAPQLGQRRLRICQGCWPL